jgi:hypothetical protein
MSLDPASSWPPAAPPTAHRPPTSRPAASADSSQDGGGRDVISQVVPRLVLFGAIPPSLLPHLVAARNTVDMPGKNADR